MDDFDFICLAHTHTNTHEPRIPYTFRNFAYKLWSKPHIQLPPILHQCFNFLVCQRANQKKNVPIKFLGKFEIGLFFFSSVRARSRLPFPKIIEINFSVWTFVPLKNYANAVGRVTLHFFFVLFRYQPKLSCYETFNQNSPSLRSPTNKPKSNENHIKPNQAVSYQTYWWKRERQRQRKTMFIVHRKWVFTCVLINILSLSSRSLSLSVLFCRLITTFHEDIERVCCVCPVQNFNWADVCWQSSWD